MPAVQWLVVTSLVMALSACEPNSALRQMPDHELAERYGFCLDREPTAPGKAQACENMRRECERRKSELGSYICRHR